MKADRIAGAYFVGEDRNLMRIPFAEREFEVLIGGAFSPTDTSRLLVESVLPLIHPSMRLLDLGCGTGIVGLVLAQLGSLPSICLSDIHERSLESVKMNFAKVHQAFEFRSGDVFDPWKDETFDVIVDDVSGVSEPVAKLSRWFAGIPCNSGNDGTDLVCRVINQAGKHLRPGGRLVFPTISLSHVETILETAKKRFRRVTRLGTKNWPIPEELLEHDELLEKLEHEQSIRLIRKFGLVLGRTEVYLAEGVIP